MYHFIQCLYCQCIIVWSWARPYAEPSMFRLVCFRNARKCTHGVEVCECFWNTNNCCLLVKLTSTENFEFFRLFLGFHFAASGWSHCMCSLFQLFFSLLHLCWIPCGASAFSSYCRMDKSFVHVPTLRTADDFPAWKQAVRLACMSLDVWNCVTRDEAEPENRFAIHLQKIR